MLYFSYGSNMSLARLRVRASSARFHTTAILPAHRLQFHKIGRDGSAKCDALPTGDPGDRVMGVVYEIAAAEKAGLDRYEGLGSGYAEKTVEVITDKGTISAFTYYATHVNTTLKPYHWYKQHVLIGARENRLPAAYIAQIEAVESIDDPDASRQMHELAIYR